MAEAVVASYNTVQGEAKEMLIVCRSLWVRRRLSGSCMPLAGRIPFFMRVKLTAQERP